MYEGACQRLHETFSETIADKLRVIATYTRERVEPFYVREELRDIVEEADFDSFHNPLWNIHRANLIASRAVRTFGPAMGSFHVYENVLLYQIPVDSNGGIYISFDPGTRHYRPLLTECRELILEAQGKEDIDTLGVV